MSRIGRKLIPIPKGVKITVNNRTVLCEGAKGKLSFELPEILRVQVTGETVTVLVEGTDRKARALHGMARAMIANMIKGVAAGFEKELQVSGVGFRGQVQGKLLNLQLGYSHPIVYHIPEGVTIEMPSTTEIKIKGIDKGLIGQAAADIRSYFPPEPYKGKGILYKGEVVRRKAGKTVA